MNVAPNRAGFRSASLRFSTPPLDHFSFAIERVASRSKQSEIIRNEHRNSEVYDSHHESTSGLSMARNNVIDVAVIEERSSMTSATTSPSIVQLRLTEMDLCGWLGQADAGDIIEYHRGFLALDCMVAARRLPEHECAKLLKLARRALWAAEQNLVHLLQRRHSPDDYSYLAIARTRPKTAPVALSALLAEEVA